MSERISSRARAVSRSHGNSETGNQSTGSRMGWLLVGGIIGAIGWRLAEKYVVGPRTTVLQLPDGTNLAAQPAAAESDELLVL